MYKAGIVAAITDLKDRNGSSLPAIKNHIKAANPGKTWANGTFLKVLKDMVASGDLVKVKGSYKLSPEYKKKLIAASKPKKKAAPKKKKAAPKKKKAAPKKKKTAPKKKAAPKKKKTAPKKKAATKKKAAPKKKTTKKKAAPKKKKTTTKKKTAAKKK